MKDLDNTSLTLGIVALTLEFISIFICGWLSIIGFVLGIVGACFPVTTAGKKIPAIVAIPLGIIFMILWIVAVAAITR